MHQEIQKVDKASDVVLDVSCARVEILGQLFPQRPNRL